MADGADKSGGKQTWIDYGTAKDKIKSVCQKLGFVGNEDQDAVRLYIELAGL